jgi:hypothetical protein
VTASRSTSKHQLIDDHGNNRATSSLLRIFATGASILVARNQMVAEGWGGLWPEEVAAAKAGTGALTNELTQLWIRHILVAEHAAAPESATMPATVCKRCNAYQSLVRSIEAQLAVHREAAGKYNEAVKTLESEREANARLTQELEQARPTTRGSPARAGNVDEDTMQDAANWRALLGSARIRSLGSAGLTTPLPNNYGHMGLELWTTYQMPDGFDYEKERGIGIDWLKRYVRIAAEAQRANSNAEQSHADGEAS